MCIRDRDGTYKFNQLGLHAVTSPMWETQEAFARTLKKGDVSVSYTHLEISEDEIERYIETGEPMDKAGSYGIQGKAAVFIKGIEGDYYNVVGFPIARFLQEIRK